MPNFEVNTTIKCPKDPSITSYTYIPDTKVEQLKWLNITVRAQGFCGQQVLTILDSLISHKHSKTSGESHPAQDTFTNLLACHSILHENFTGQTKYLTKDIPYNIWSLVFCLVLHLAHADVHTDLLAQPAALLHPSLDLAAVNRTWRHDVVNDAAFWSFVPVHLGCVLQGDPYELSQVKAYIDRIGDSIPVHLCAGGWMDADEACTAALKALPFLHTAPESVAGPNVKELTVIGMIDRNGSGTLKRFPAVSPPFVPALSGHSVLNSSSGITHHLGQPLLDVTKPTHFHPLTTTYSYSLNLSNHFDYHITFLCYHVKSGSHWKGRSWSDDLIL